MIGKLLSIIWFFLFFLIFLMKYIVVFVGNGIVFFDGRFINVVLNVIEKVEKFCWESCVVLFGGKFF